MLYVFEIAEKSPCKFIEQTGELSLKSLKRAVFLNRMQQLPVPSNCPNAVLLLYILQNLQEKDHQRDRFALYKVRELD